MKTKDSEQLFSICGKAEIRHELPSVSEYIQRIESGDDYTLFGYSMRDFPESDPFFQWVQFSYIRKSVPDLEESACKISVCILTHNNAGYIEMVIRSIQSFAYEIIVIDSESTDGTYEIALRIADTVISTENARGFDEKRNIGITHSKGDWILMLDSDEALSCHAFSKLRKFITWADYHSVDVFWLSRYWLKPSGDTQLEHFVGSLNLWPDPQARLFRNDSSCRYIFPLHEKLRSSGAHRKACFISNEFCALFHLKYWICSEQELLSTIAWRKSLKSENDEDIQLLPWRFQKTTIPVLNEIIGDNLKDLIQIITNKE